MGITKGASWLVPDVFREPLRGLRAALRGDQPGGAPASTQNSAQHSAQRSGQPSARRSTQNSAQGALERVGMEAYAHRPIGELSGGQQQRVFLARALAQEADLYLMDEPFAGVDVTTEEILSTELRALCDQGKTVVAVHHDLDDVASRFDEVAVLNRELIASGPTRATLNLDAVRRAFRLPAESTGGAKSPDLAASNAD